jgi:arylsulfatase A-like enzyme
MTQIHSQSMTTQDFLTLKNLEDILLLALGNDSEYIINSLNDNTNSINSIIHHHPPVDDDEPLNILILYPDDWRHDDLGDVNPALQTPTFTALAADGIRFTYNAVTTSICWISRASLFSGQYATRHKSAFLFRPYFAQIAQQWQQSWPFLLQQQAGYWTGHIGKWQYRDMGGYKNRIFNFSSYFEGWITQHDARTNTTRYNAELARDETIRFLRTRPQHVPFAATVAFYPPKGIHNPNEAMAQYTAMYDSTVHQEVYDRNEAYRRLPSFIQNNLTEARARYRYRFETHGDYQTNMVAQYATITHIDAVCGDIIQELKQQGVYNRTLIIVTADNGEFHGRHALADKWYPYQESIRVPLIIHDPRMSTQQRGTLNDAFTLNIDLAPTILGAAGIKAPDSMQGMDIADLYRKPTQPWPRTEWYYEFPDINDAIPPSIALINRTFKYIEWWKNGNKRELFDLEKDPYELQDLSDRSDLQQLQQDMRHRLHTLRHEAYGPDSIPGTRCDSLLKPGTDITKLPNCSQYFPHLCCQE